MQTFNLQDNQNDVYTPTYVDAAGNATPAPGAISYTVFDDFGNAPLDKGLIHLTPALDTSSVVVKAVGTLGSQRVRVISGPVSFDVTYSIVAGPAISGAMTAGTPQNN